MGATAINIDNINTVQVKALAKVAAAQDTREGRISSRAISDHAYGTVAKSAYETLRAAGHIVGVPMTLTATGAELLAETLHRMGAR